MTKCPHCESVLPNRTDRYGLTVTDNPWRLFYKGEAIPMVEAMQCRILSSLLRTGECASTVLDMWMGPDTGPRTLLVHISRLRKTLRFYNIPVEIVNRHGWGYQLKEIKS
jgi:hypothetical protein